MSPRGESIIRVDCACGHRAVLRAADLGEDPLTFRDFHRLRCRECGRKGRPAVVICSWTPASVQPPYQGSYRTEQS
ncbi:hypothetical protein JI664_21485 [Rhodobacter sp. NTK016B]|uniref:hypothetical protein n=1 Tax=Rhodobacter sp. NTK016B TaxID=2759676 RepID=UPI001A8EC2E1|nr:hypothetical protein [Rhodobacter sp. NTK016B]MBN8294560.1 hypothetical protein [Rhodobacter sp. NTK016B]